MPNTPTQSQIESAKAYILQRIDAQSLLEDRLTYEFEQAATKIAQIVLKYRNRNQRLRFTGNSAMSREIQSVIDDLERQIDYYTEYYSIPDEAEDDPEREQLLLAHLHDIDHGYTFDDRETLYLSNYLKGLQDFDFDEYEDEDTLIAAVQEATEKPKSRLFLLALNTVAVSFAYNALQDATSNHAIGFYVYQGSANPCRYCTDQHYRFHPMEEYPSGGYHVRCRCTFVFVYV